MAKDWQIKKSSKSAVICKIALAPMAGVTDSAFRLMNKLGGVDLVYSEMTHVNAIGHGNKKTLSLLGASPFEFPYVVQLFGNDPKYFAEASRIISKQGVPVIQYKTFSDKQITFIEKFTHPTLVTLGHPSQEGNNQSKSPLERGGSPQGGRGVLLTENEISTGFKTFYSNFIALQKQFKNTNYIPYIIPSGLDINLGCPAKRVCGHGSGAALWKDLKKVRAILEATLKNTKLPVSVKIRTAVNEVTMLDLLDYVKDLPIKHIMVHGRSYGQGFSGPIDTGIIKKAIKKYPRFEFWINGGIVDRESAREIVKKTGCFNLGIARGTYGNPLLASILSSPFKGEVPESSRAEGSNITINCLLAYIHSLLAHQSKGKKGIFEMRKHLAWYFKDFPGAKTWRKKLVTVETIPEIEKILFNVSKHKI